MDPGDISPFEVCFDMASEREAYNHFGKLFCVLKGLLDNFQRAVGKKRLEFFRVKGMERGSVPRCFCGRIENRAG